jgi:tetratricopeptide (TPR) repeat protein
VSLGKTALARVHLEQASRHPYRVALAYLGWAQWHLGYLDQARTSLENALQSSANIPRPYTVATILGVASVAYYLLRDYGRMFELAEALLAVSAEHGITYYHALAKLHLGAALAGLGNTEDRIAHLTEGISAFTTTGTKLVLPYCKLALAEALRKSGTARLRPPNAGRDARFCGTKRRAIFRV